MATNVIFFKTLQKTNVVFLKNPSKKKILHKSGERKGKVKQIQPIMYSADHDTIIMEEIKKLDKNAVATPISTRKGSFRVQEDDVHLLEYLRQSEQNEANGGKLFKEVNVQKEEMFQIEGFKAYDKAINLVMDSSDNEARALAMEFLSPSAVNNTIQKIKLQLRNKLGNNDKLVEDVTYFMEDKISEERLLIAIAINDKIIELQSGQNFVWKGTNEKFFVASQASDAISEVCLWMKNDNEGRQYMKAISNKVSPNKEE